MFFDGLVNAFLEGALGADLQALFWKPLNCPGVIADLLSAGPWGPKIVFDMAIICYIMVAYCLHTHGNKGKLRNGSSRTKDGWTELPR